MPTLPLEKDGQQRIMRDMWLEGDIEDSLLALAKELGWLKDLAKYSKVMAPASQKKLEAALATAGASAGVKSKKKKRAGELNAGKPGDNKETEMNQQMKQTAKAVARLILSGKCRRIAFLTGAGCSVGAGMCACCLRHRVCGEPCANDRCDKDVNAKAEPNAQPDTPKRSPQVSPISGHRVACTTP